jgi:hypothetical protein
MRRKKSHKEDDIEADSCSSRRMRVAKIKNISHYSCDGSEAIRRTDRLSSKVSYAVKSVLEMVVVLTKHVL